MEKEEGEKEEKQWLSGALTKQNPPADSLVLLSLKCRMWANGK
jgi:hypothetical protein